MLENIVFPEGNLKNKYNKYLGLKKRKENEDGEQQPLSEKEEELFDKIEEELSEKFDKLSEVNSRALFIMLKLVNEMVGAENTIN